MKTKKCSRRLLESMLPEPFASYWRSKDRLERAWDFYDVEGELYIHDWTYADSPSLMRHWTQAPCCGVQNFMRDRGIKELRLPLVAIDGTFLFEIRYTHAYETSAVHPRTGQQFVVHSG